MKFSQYLSQKVLWIFVLISLVGIMAGGFALGLVLPGFNTLSLNQENAPGDTAPLSDSISDNVTVAEKLMPTVVGISTEKISQDLFMQGPIATGVGSGVIVRSNGYILTNDHVISGADNIDVILEDGSQLKAKKLWSDPGLDLGIIKINVENLTPAQLGDSNRLRIGEPVIAIGNPLGLKFQRTVTAGIVSALDRVISVPTERGREKVMENLIQTDASINPGNSGGPLVNNKGQVVGINTVKVTSAEGIGFSVPINVAKPIVNRVVEDGKFVRPGLGVVAFDRDIARYYNKQLGLDKGVLIMEVQTDSPAHKAGLKENDLILRINNKTIDNMLDLRETLYSLRVGDKVTVTFWRNGLTRKTKAALEEL